MDTVIIENWAYICSLPSEYSAPEQGISRFVGNVYNHPNRPDGDCVQTSEILDYDEETDEFICLSRRYKLGKVLAEYEEKFPGAKERLISQMIKIKCKT